MIRAWSFRCAREGLLSWAITRSGAERALVRRHARQPRSSINEELKDAKANAIARPPVEVTGSGHLSPGIVGDDDERSPLLGVPTVDESYRGYDAPASFDH